MQMRMVDPIFTFGGSASSMITVASLRAASSSSPAWAPPPPSSAARVCCDAGCFERVKMLGKLMGNLNADDFRLAAAGAELSVSLLLAVIMECMIN